MSKHAGAKQQLFRKLPSQQSTAKSLYITQSVVVVEASQHATMHSITNRRQSIKCTGSWRHSSFVSSTTIDPIDPGRAIKLESVKGINSGVTSHSW
eukprot:scaffold148925_cov18-Tisochrysis_lutea.AAC.1